MNILCTINFEIPTTLLDTKFKYIGVLRSVFLQKTGTPRQGSVCKNSRGALTIDENVFNNPEHSLDGLTEFSHVWYGLSRLIYVTICIGVVYTCMYML